MAKLNVTVLVESYDKNGKSLNKTEGQVVLPEISKEEKIKKIEA